MVRAWAVTLAWLWSTNWGREWSPEVVNRLDPSPGAARSSLRGGALEEVRKRDPPAAASEAGRAWGAADAPPPPVFSPSPFSSPPPPRRPQRLQPFEGAPVDLAEEVEERGCRGTPARGRAPWPWNGARCPPPRPRGSRCVDRDGDCPEAGRAEPEDEVGRGVGKPEGHPVAVSDPELREPAGGAARGVVELREGEAPAPVRDGVARGCATGRRRANRGDGLHRRVGGRGRAATRLARSRSPARARRNGERARSGEGGAARDATNRGSSRFPPCPVRGLSGAVHGLRQYNAAVPGPRSTAPGGGRRSPRRW